jgi:hypothetical protein
MGRACLLALALVSSQARAFTPDGLYLMTRFMGGSLEMKAWLFRGGRFAQEPKGDLNNFDFGAAEREAPGSTGTYTQDGDKWTFQWAGGRRATGRYEAGQPAGVCFYWDAGSFCPVQAFARDQRLEGAFTGSIGTAAASAARTLTFGADGRYRLEGSGVVAVRPEDGVERPGGWWDQSGRYRLSGNLLVLQPDEGPATSLTTFPYDDGTQGPQPRRMYVGGFMLRRMADKAPQP